MRPDLISALKLILLLVKTPILFHNSNSTTSNEFVRQLAGQVANTTCLVSLHTPEGLQLAKEVQKVGSHHLHLLSFTNDLKLINSTLTKIANEKTPLRFYMPFEPVTDANELAETVRMNFGLHSYLYLLRSENGSDYIDKLSAWSLDMDEREKLWLDTAHFNIFNEIASRETNQERWFDLTFSKFLNESKSGRIEQNKAAEFKSWLQVISSQISESKRDLKRVIPHLPEEMLRALCGIDYLRAGSPKSDSKEVEGIDWPTIVFSVFLLPIPLFLYIMELGCQGNRLTLLCTTCLIIYSLTYLLCGYLYQHYSPIYIFTRDLSLSLVAFRSLLIIKRLCQIECPKQHRTFLLLFHMIEAAIVYSLFSMSLVLHLQNIFNLTSSFKYPFVLHIFLLNCYESVIYHFELQYPVFTGLDSNAIVSNIIARLELVLQTFRTIRQTRIEATPPVVNEV